MVADSTSTAPPAPSGRVTERVGGQARVTDVSYGIVPGRASADADGIPEYQVARRVLDDVGDRPRTVRRMRFPSVQDLRKGLRFSHFLTESHFFEHKVAGALAQRYRPPGCSY